MKDGRETGRRPLPGPIDRIDRRLTSWMADNGVRLTRLALGIVFLWFGIIKLGPGWSPATDLVDARGAGDE